MLNLPNTTSTLEVVTGAAVVSISVHASFVDYAYTALPPTVTPSWQNTLIVLAVTTTVVLAPTSPNVDRNIKFLSINNASATPCAVTVQYFDGAAHRPLFGPVTLGAAWSLHYTTDGAGFVVYDNMGRIQEA